MAEVVMLTDKQTALSNYHHYINLPPVTGNIDRMAAVDETAAVIKEAPEERHKAASCLFHYACLLA